MTGERVHNINYSSFFYSIVLGSCVVIIGIFFGYARQHVIVETQKAETRLVLELVSQKMQNIIREINNVGLMLALTVDQNGEISNFDKVSQSLINKYPTINMLELIDDGVVTHVYPKGINENILGFDLYSNSRIKKEIFDAASIQSIYLAGPTMLIEGRLGVIGLLPYYVKEDYIKLTAVIVYLDDFLDRAQLSSYTDTYNFELSKINPKTDEEKYYLNNINNIKNKELLSIDIPEGAWTLYAEKIDKNPLISVFVIIIFFSVLAGLLTTYLFYQIFNRPVLLESLLLDRTKELLQSREQFKQSSELLSSILDSPQNVIIYSVDNKSQFIAFNNNYKKLVKHFFRVNVEHGLNILNVYPKHLANDLKNQLERALKGESFYFTQELYDRNNFLWYWDNWFSPVTNKNGDILGVTVFSVNITDRKKAEKEKNTLLSEIHHRVKNNLAIVSGLLELQKIEMDNEKLSIVFDKSINRIISIALVHELMYNNENLSSVDVRDYMKKLIPAITATMQNKLTNVRFDLDIVAYELNINEAIPLGLMLNELITNSYKYAFKDRTDNVITVSLKIDGKKIQVIYSDNGWGYPDYISFDNPKNLGLTLLHAQIEQLEASYQIDTKNKFYLEFSFESKKKGSHSTFQ